MPLNRYGCYILNKSASKLSFKCPKITSCEASCPFWYLQCSQEITPWDEIFTEDDKSTLIQKTIHTWYSVQTKLDSIDTFERATNNWICAWELYFDNKMCPTAEIIFDLQRFIRNLIECLFSSVLTCNALLSFTAKRVSFAWTKRKHKKYPNILI